MPKAYSYIRMSTKEQLKGNSSDRQISLTKKYAEENGLDLVTEYEDIGISGFRGANSRIGAFADFLKLAKEDKIETGSYLLVESLDRISRDDALEAFSLLSNIINAGIVVVTLSDNQVFSKDTFSANPTNLMFAITIMIRAHDESKLKSHRGLSSWSKKRELIRSGKISSQRIPAWLKFNEDKTAIEPIVERVQILNEIFNLSKDGWGSYSIARHINQQNIKPWGRGKYWHESYIKKILSNRSVLGEFQPKRLLNDGDTKRTIEDGDPVANYYPAVIDEKLYAAVQLAISKRKQSGSGRKGKNHSNLFSGILKCSNCNASMRFLNKGKKPKGGKYLRCSNSLLGGGCSGPSWRYADVEQAIIETIDVIDFEALIEDNNSSSKLAELHAKKHQLTVEYEEIQQKIENLAGTIETMPSPSETLMNQLRNREEQSAAITESTKRIATQIAGLEQQQPAEQKKAILEVVQLLQSDGDSQHKIRKKLASELRLVLSHISIKHTPDAIWDLSEDDPDWFQNLGTKQMEFLKLHRRFGFEVHIHYDNKNVHIFNALSKELVLIEYHDQVTPETFGLV